MPTDQDRREDDEPGLLDEVADKLGFRARMKTKKGRQMINRKRRVGRAVQVV